MKKNYRLIAQFVVVLFIFFLGVRIGKHHTSHRLNSNYSTVLYLSAATGINTKVNLLELLQKGDVMTSRKRLEALIDADLAYLALYVDKKPEEPDKDILEAIKKLKKYRERYPGHSINNAIEKSVIKTIDYVK